MPQVASCMFMYLPALSCTVVHRGREKERGKREGREGEVERRRKSGRQGRPAKAFWKNLKLKTRAPEQYDHRETCTGALVFDFKSYISQDQKQWIYSPGQSGTVRDINFRS